MSSLRLAAVVLQIGALAFGGLGATLALIERELIDQHSAIAEALTHTKLLPGSTVVAAALLLIALTRVHPMALLAGSAIAGWLSNRDTTDKEKDKDAADDKSVCHLA